MWGGGAGGWWGTCMAAPPGRSHPVVPVLTHPANLAPTRCPASRPQFPSDEEAEVELEIRDDALAAKNEKVGGRWGW